MDLNCFLEKSMDGLDLFFGENHGRIGIVWIDWICFFGEKHGWRICMFSSGKVGWKKTVESQAHTDAKARIILGRGRSTVWRMSQEHTWPGRRILFLANM